MPETLPQRSLFATVARSLVVYSVLVSMLFLCALMLLYQARLKEQRADAAARINLLLQVSLENAMLKRDIPGLKDIVERLGQHDGIRAVMILDPLGTVRFSSDDKLLKRTFNLNTAELCSDCIRDGARPIDRTELLPTGVNADEPVMRSVKSVANRESCRQCHGDPAVNPINGLLVVDHDARDLQRNALLGALALAGSGLLVVIGLVAGIWRVLDRNVLQPVASLTGASRELARGRLDQRVIPSGGAELAELGRSFNDMANRLRRSLHELSERERFVQALLDALPDAVRVIDSDFRIILANRAYREQLGLGDNDPVGFYCHASSHGRSHPCIPTLATCPLVELQKPDAHIKFHARHIRADGGELSVEVNAVRLDLQGENGPRRLIIEAIRDLDATVRISHEQRLSEIGQLATGVAHEIRNPLSSIAMLLDNVERTLPAQGTENASESLRLIGQEVDRCLAITESLLKLGTPSGGQHQLIGLNDLVAEVAALLHFEAEERGVTVTTQMEIGLRVLATDSDLRMVMINLMQNAFHAMPKGGTLTLTGVHRAGRILLSVADTGVGIPPADIPMIFLPFWSRRADGVNGTGLGLSICQSVLRGLGGVITVSSPAGSGATFTVDLPDPDAQES